MHKFLSRRVNDGIFFVVLMAALGSIALALHLHPLRPSVPNGDLLIRQAQAWLHGHLDIGEALGDTILIGGKVYIIYPPLPALLMLPFVAVLHSKFSDVWFTWAFAALNIVLLFRTLEVMRVRHITTRTPLENGIIALAFGFGTIALWLGLDGKVWFTIQTISICGIIFTLHSTLCRRWSLATLGVGLVALTRTSDALIALVPLVVYLHDLGVGRRIQSRWQLLPERWPSPRELAITLAPFIIAMLILLIHNKLYFGNPLSSGYDIQNQQDYPSIKYGVLSWHYIWPNVVVDFLRWPSFHFTGPFDVNPQPDLMIDGVGTNIFFTTPLLALFLFAPQGKTPQPWLRYTFWGTVATMLMTLLLFCATGWNQVGARYLFSLYPLLFLLLAQRAARLDVRWLSLAGLSVFINLLLARTFWESPPTVTFAVGSAGIVLLACIMAFLLLYWQKRQQQVETAPLPTVTASLRLTPSKDEMVTR